MHHHLDDEDDEADECQKDHVGHHQHVFAVDRISLVQLLQVQAPEGNLPRERIEFRSQITKLINYCASDGKTFLIIVGQVTKHLG